MVSVDVKHHVYLLHRVRPSDTRLDRLPSVMSSMTAQFQASGRGLAALLGQMESLSPLLPLGRLHSQQFQREFRDRLSRAGMTWDTLVPVGQ